jgi:hypothetical protein
MGGDGSTSGWAKAYETANDFDGLPVALMKPCLYHAFTTNTYQNN